MVLELMSYEYTCQICGEELNGDTVDGLVVAAKRHYANQHGMLNQPGERDTNLRYDEEDIREDIEEE